MYGKATDDAKVGSALVVAGDSDIFLPVKKYLNRGVQETGNMRPSATKVDMSYKCEFAQLSKLAIFGRQNNTKIQSGSTHNRKIDLAADNGAISHH